MKSLVLDLGNSTLFAGIFRDEHLVRSARIDVGRGLRTPPASNVSFKAGFGDPALQSWAERLKRLTRGSVDQAALCSVVPERTEWLASCVRQTFGLEPQVLTATAEHGLRIAYRRPAQLGADRVATALGARRLHPGKDVIVVDCGTATTLTVVGRDGVLHGGAILPGLALWPAMVAQRTAQLPQVKLSPPAQVVATDTAAALRSGIVVGHAGAIRELVARSRAEIFGRRRIVVVGTGGMVTHLKGQSLFTVVEPALILHGLEFFLRQTPAHA